MHKLSETVERKFIDSVDVFDWEIDTDSGFVPITHVHKTVEYDVWRIETEDGSVLECADTHIVFDENLNEIFVKDCVPNKTKIMTRDGSHKVVSVQQLSIPAENMYDLSLDSIDKRFYSGNILSHNSTTTCGFILWYIIFQADKTVALLANKGETARELLGRVQLAYQHLPKWLQQGVKEWNKGSFELENNSRVIAAATSASSIRGYTISLLVIDEASFVDNWDEFFTSVYPTISSGKDSKVVLVSTPNGLNHFYSIWVNAKEGRNGYNPIMVTWRSVPGRDEKWKQETLAGMNFDMEKFNQEMECVSGDTLVIVRDKETKKIETLTIAELNRRCEFLGV